MYCTKIKNKLIKILEINKKIKNFKGQKKSRKFDLIQNLKLSQISDLTKKLLVKSDKKMPDHKNT